MKTKSSLILGAAIMAGLVLAGCGKNEPAAAAPKAKPAAAATASAQTDAPAEGRAIKITANDTMRFNVTELHAKPGEALAVTLTNEGTAPKFSMGHNWVLLKIGTNLEEFTSEGANAAATEYIADSTRGSVLALTKLLGPKESDTVRFYAPKEPGHYPFLCTFPGHMQVGMKGVLIVE